MALCQTTTESKVWNSTRLLFVGEQEELPSLAERAEWLEWLPSQPARPWASRWMSRWSGGAVEPIPLADPKSALKNARALQGKLQLAGWLDAKVEASFRLHRRGAMLELMVQCGPRWHVDSVRFVTQGTGLPKRGMASSSGLVRGLPFEQSRLQEAQERMAEYAKSQGFHTFHSGLVTFSADTLGKTPDEGLDLTVRCAPWEYNPNSGLSLSGAAEGGLRKHPRVRVGEVTWNGGQPGEESRPGGLRKEAWAHVVTLQPGEVYSPASMRANYGRLSRLRSVDRVNPVTSLRWDSTAAEVEVGLPGQAVMDVDFVVTQKSSHDLGVELDLVRNDARYGPKLGVTLLHRNPRGWGAENAWDVGFGYVAVAPFSTFTTANVLNSGEWTLRWSTKQLGVLPLPLRWFKASAEPSTRWDVGWDREIWPEFTRSQIHLTEDIHLTENPQRQSQMSFSPMDVSFVNLTNIDPSFQQWLSDQNNPLVEARFNNHLTLGSSAGWDSNWSVQSWGGRVSVHSSWAGMLAQRLANRWAAPTALDEATGAWLISDGVPLVQHQRIVVNGTARHEGARAPRHVQAANVRIGFANAGKNTPSLPLEQAFFSGGANGIRGWRLRTLGPGNAAFTEGSSAITGVGDVRVDLQLEWRSTLNKDWQLAGFTDAGNVWLHGPDVPAETAWSWKTLEGWGWSAGVGFRYDLDFFLLRMDGAVRLHDPSQPSGERWMGQGPVRGALHLGLGLPF